MAATKPITVIIADDHRLFMEGIKSVLQQSGEVTILAEARNGEQLVSFVKTYKPGVVITDIAMPVMNGIEAIKQIKKTNPSTSVIGISYSSDPQIMEEVIKAGANSFLQKGCPPEEILNAIKAVKTGGFYCTETMTAHVVGLMKKAKKQRGISPTLTARETQITKLVCRQLSNKEIAAQLGLSERTVEDHRNHIQRKTGARNMVGIALYAIKNKIINPHNGSWH